MSDRDAAEDLTMAERAALRALPFHDPPGDFGTRVLRQHQQRARARRWLAFGLAAAAVVAAIVALPWLRDRDPLPLETHRARQRGTVAVGERAVAVLEAGAEIMVARGDTTVRQPRGSVFYRVDRGDRAFSVETEAATTTVRGTCFRVEVIETDVAEATTVVTVSEGSVVVENARGRTVLSAGERATVTLGAAPRREAAAPPTSPSPSEDTETLRVDNATLRAEVERLRSSCGTGGAPPEAQDERALLEPTPAELESRADRCELVLQVPHLVPRGTFGLDPEEATRLGLSARQTAEAVAAYEEATGQITGELRALYREVTGEDAVALDAESLIAEIMAKTPDLPEAFARLSAERAGRLAPPADPSSSGGAERLMRLLATAGDRVERELAAAIGAERARALRRSGPPFGAARVFSGCP